MPTPHPRKCMDLVTRGHFRSRDNYGGHTIQSVIAENPMIQANLVSLSFIEHELWTIEVLYCGNRDFRLFAPVTLTLMQWPSYMNLTRILWRCTGCTNINFLCRGFRKLSSDRHTYITDRQTDRHGLSFFLFCVCIISLSVGLLDISRTLLTTGGQLRYGLVPLWQPAKYV